MRPSNRIAPAFAALLLALTLIPAIPPVSAQTAASHPQHIERIARVGRLWGEVRYLHPYLAYRDIDWDAALLAALPRIREAKTPEEYGAAVQSMLATLDDPATRVLPKREERPPRKPPSTEKPAEMLRKLDGEIVLLDLAAAAVLSPQEMYERSESAAKELSAAPAVIVDLRGLADLPGQAVYYGGRALEQLQPSLLSLPARAPAQRYVLHSGYRPQDGASSGGYYSGFLTLAADTFAPPTGSGIAPAPATPKRVVFLISPDVDVPPVIVALQAAGLGSIVSEGEVSEESLVQVRFVDLGEGVRARFRVSEIVPLPGWPGFHTDAQVPAGQSDAALAAALTEARRAPAAARAEAAPPQPLPDPVFRLDPTYPDLLQPDLPHRWLAVIRAWNVIHFFYPYLHLLDGWDPVLPEFLARMEPAETGLDYGLTLQEMMARVADGHTTLAGHPEIPKFFGEVGLPLELRWMEGAPVVTAIFHDAVREAGIEIGDAILSVDGEPVADRIQKRWKYIPGSTETTIRQRICRSLLRGPAGSTAVLSLQGVDGKVREVRMVREQRPFVPPAKGETVRILPGNIGYMDLTRLTVAEVDAAFEKIKFTRGLVFDMRGYPNGTAWSIAPRINTRNAKVGAQFRRSQLSAFSAEEGEAGFYFSQPLPELPPGEQKYTRPTVMVIDDRAISQSEHTGLFFEAANGTRFIGTPTAGANGDVTTFTLPGNLQVSFTGHDVRHADGSQLQRKGLIPHVEAAPTRAGLRAGKDEVLERALQDLEQTLAREAKESKVP